MTEIFLYYNFMKMLVNSKEYLSILENIKQKIKIAQYKAVISVNSEMLLLYWQIGNVINKKASWGSKFIDNLAKDIKKEIPYAKGYSIRNLKYMSKFARTYPDYEIVQEALAQITWYHHITLIDKVKDAKIREWYIQKIIENGWSRNVLVHQIESKLYNRQAKTKKINNFATTLPKPQSELAVQTLKDPFIFDFIDFREGMIEKEIENELVKNITKLLLELGSGFAFIGNQYHLEVGNEDFYIDLLFYNLNLRCYVIIELKTGAFKPEYAGKLNFYLSAVDLTLKKEMDNPTIGILLCKTKNNLIAEYALRAIENPIGVGEYKVFEKLPKKYKDILPSAKDIENKILKNSLLEH